MASDFDVAPTTALSPMDKIYWGERIRDDLHRRRNQVLKKPDRKDSRGLLPENIRMADVDGTAEYRLDLRA